MLEPTRGSDSTLVVKFNHAITPRANFYNPNETINEVLQMLADYSCQFHNMCKLRRKHVRKNTFGEVKDRPGGPIAFTDSCTLYKIY